MIPNTQFVDIVNMNRPIYRVFSNQRILEMFRDRKLTLTAPRLWDDPFENFLAKCPALVKSINEHVSLSGIFKNFFGQCWTYHEDNDAMWRIYSPKKTGHE